MPEKKAPTQCELVMTHLTKYGSITSNEAEELYGIHRLASRITDLKNAGFHFRSERLTGKNRYGKKTSYARYWLDGGC